LTTLAQEAKLATPDISKLKIDRNAAAKPGGFKRRKPWGKIAVALVVVAGGASMVMRNMNARPAVETSSASLAYPSQNYTLLNATGYVVAQRKAAISSKATGRLEWLGVLEGSKVKKNEVIARLESRDVSAVLGQAQANVKVAQANLETAEAELQDASHAAKRSQDLLSQKFIAQANHDSAQARLNKAKASVSAARASITSAQANAQVAQVALEQTIIRAPFDGVILTKNANVGDNITPFSSAADSKGAVVTIADMATLEVEADVSESNLSKISVGQAVEVTLDAFPELRIAGQVARMVPTVDRSKATLLVKVRFGELDPRVLPDMSAKVAFLSKPVPDGDRKPVVAVQPAALAKRDGKNVAFVVKEDKLKQVAVNTGRKVGELLEVSGIAAGDKLVLAPDDKLTDGTLVTVVKK
jgi:HlyD family secretion protein